MLRHVDPGEACNDILLRAGGIRRQERVTARGGRKLLLAGRERFSNMGVLVCGGWVCPSLVWTLQDCGLLLHAFPRAVKFSELGGPIQELLDL